MRRTSRHVWRTRSGDDASLLRGRTARLGTGRGHDGESIPAAAAEPSGPGKGAQGTMSSTLERNRGRSAGVADAAGLGSCARALRQCRRDANDASRLRVRVGEARSGGGRDVYVVTRPFDIASSAEAQLRGDHVAGHARHPKGRLVLGHATSAPRRSTCAWIPPKSWRRLKRSFRRNCGADGSSAGCVDRLLIGGPIGTAGLKKPSCTE